MLNNILKNIFGTQDERRIKKMQPFVDAVAEAEESIARMSDGELRSRSDTIREDLRGRMRSVSEDIDRVRELVKNAATPQEKIKHKKDVKAIKNRVIEPKLAEVFALVREASKRAIGLRHFDVQLIGGIVLHEGNIAEMTTGEGKTLVATLPAVLNAMAGEVVHVVTVNDYLAKRDSEWMGPVYRFLGLSVGVIQHDMRPEERKQQYACDIVYGTNNEFGFDYLRDNMVLDAEDMVQRELGFAIVDEVDSILIDEARTPLIISGPVDETNEAYNDMRGVVDDIVRCQKRLVSENMAGLKKILGGSNKNEEEAGNLLYLIHKADPKNREFLDMILKDRAVKSLLDRAQASLDSKVMEKEKADLLEDLYYVFDEKSRDATFSTKGLTRMKEKFSVEFMLEDIESKLAELSDQDISEDEKIAMKNELTVSYVQQQRNVESVKQLLKAYILFEKDVDYVINENKIVIVDSFTGRMMPGRRFSDGLHEAIEAKEKVEVQRESQTLATITLQNYFRMYDKLAGMTGTAKTEEGEFDSIYALSVVRIPTNRPLNRKNLPDRIYKTEKEKFDAIADVVGEWQDEGKPVLVGTVSIEKSEKLSATLTKKGIRHNVLNAKHHEREAHIIAQAGRYGAVTIATNMAGRGTDILLGGNAESMAEDNVDQIPDQSPEERQIAYENFFKEAKEKTRQEHEKVVAAGGLHVVGTERHESRRIDNQLRGRAGRQGDPGASRFYLSLEDDLMRIFGSDRIKAVMDHLGMEEGEVIENPLVTRAIRTAQQRVESQNFEIRKHLLKYDDIMNRQREVIYNRRHMILASDDLRSEFLECLSVGLETLLETWDEDPDADVLIKELMYKYALNISEEQLERKNANNVIEIVTEVAGKAYSDREKFLGRERTRHIEKMIMLSVIDTNWKEYLREVDELREGISWRAYAQKDPFVEFQHEAFAMFRELMIKIDEQVAEKIMKVSAMEEHYKKSVYVKGEQKLEHKEYSSLGVPAAGQDDFYGSEDKRASVRKNPHMPEGQGVTLKRDAPKVGRNDPCPCGSGKKYKKCCGS